MFRFFVLWFVTSWLWPVALRWEEEGKEAERRSGVSGESPED
jgi:hypothetical protein